LNMRKHITKAAGLLGCTVPVRRAVGVVDGKGYGCGWVFVNDQRVCWQCVSLWAALAATWGGCVALSAGWLK
jgi:hypothetical protein